MTKKQKMAVDVGGERVDGTMLKDIGGMKDVISRIQREVIEPLYYREMMQYMGVEKPLSGILLSGPPGCGKTMLAQAIANEADLTLHMISAPAVVSGVSGGSEENIRNIFSKAQRTAPSVVFIDEIDAIASIREEAMRGMEGRIVAQMVTCMDESYKAPGFVLVIGATKTPDALHPALRIPGRFDLEIVLEVPDEDARAEILSVLANSFRLDGPIDLRKIAKSTPGFVGADLKDLMYKAANLARIRIVGKHKSKVCKDETKNKDFWKEPEEMKNIGITMQDLEEALLNVQPSTGREVVFSVSNVTWEDVVGLDDLKELFVSHIVQRVKDHKPFEDFGLELYESFLLHGPTGCGKTLIAKAVAHESGASFIHVKCYELLSKNLGDGEVANVDTMFRCARERAPCVLFFDEVDAIASKRDNLRGMVAMKLFYQLFYALQSRDKPKGVFVIAATNRLDEMDEGMLMPNRFRKKLHVPMPSQSSRGSILKALSREKPVDPSVDYEALGQMNVCNGFSGADIASMVHEADEAAREESLKSDPNGATYIILKTHFEQAAEIIRQSITIEEVQSLAKE